MRRRPDDDEKSTYHRQNDPERDARAQEKGRQPHARSRVAISTWATNKHKARRRRGVGRQRELDHRKARAVVVGAQVRDEPFMGGRLFSASRHAIIASPSAGAASIKFGICLNCQYENKPTPQPKDWACAKAERASPVL